MVIFALLIAASGLQLIACDCFGGNFVEFEAHGKFYLAGWDETVTKAGAEAKCGSVSANLATFDNDDKVVAVGLVLGNLDTTGAQLTGQKIARFWIGGMTSVANHKQVTGNPLTTSDGNACRSLTDFQHTKHPEDPYRIYSKPCDDQRYFLCESQRPMCRAPPKANCFAGKSVSFEAGGRYYVAGWDNTVTQDGAREKCKSMFSVLADLNTDAKLAVVGNVLGNMDTTGAQLTGQKIARFWLEGRNNARLHQQMTGSELAHVNNGEYCKSVTDFQRTKHPEDPFRIYCKKCEELRYFLCESDRPICELDEQ